MAQALLALWRRTKASDGGAGELLLEMPGDTLRRLARRAIDLYRCARGGTGRPADRAVLRLREGQFHALDRAQGRAARSQ